jgi:hypothetical protein
VRWQQDDLRSVAAEYICSFDLKQLHHQSIVYRHKISFMYLRDGHVLSFGIKDNLQAQAASIYPLTQSGYRYSDLSSSLSSTPHHLMPMFDLQPRRPLLEREQHNTMCRFKLRVCPYPHQDQISAFIFNPGSAEKWQHCDKTQPWSRLSCGDLVVEHSLVDLNPQYAIEDFYPFTRCPNGKPEPYEPIVDGIRVLDRKNGAKDMRGECKWCTTVLKLVAAKSKEVQRHARAEIEKLEKKMLTDAQLRDIRKEAKETERQLDMWRARVWTRANKLIQEVKPTVDESKAVMNGKCNIKISTDSDKGEKVDN